MKFIVKYKYKFNCEYVKIYIKFIRYNYKMTNVMDNVLETTIQAYLAQMDSAMKVSDLLAKHAVSSMVILY